MLFLSFPGFRPSFLNATRDIETIGLLYSVRNEGVENIVRLHDCYSRTVMIVQPDCTTLTVRLYFAGCKKKSMQFCFINHPIIINATIRTKGMYNQRQKRCNLSQRTAIVSMKGMYSQRQKRSDTLSSFLSNMILSNLILVAPFNKRNADLVGMLIVC